LAAAEKKLSSSKVAVLRFDAEVYESLGHLAAALLAAAAQKLSPNIEKAGEAIKRFAAKLKPQMDYDLADQSLSITFGTSAKPIPQTLPLLTDVLNVSDRIAAGPINAQR
jgi:hypothetical protein